MKKLEAEADRLGNCYADACLAIAEQRTLEFELERTRGAWPDYALNLRMSGQELDRAGVSPREVEGAVKSALGAFLFHREQTRRRRNEVDVEGPRRMIHDYLECVAPIQPGLAGATPIGGLTPPREA